MDRETRRLVHEKGSRIKSVSSPPIARDGKDGDMYMFRGTLYIKDNNSWYEFASRIPAVSSAVDKSTNGYHIFDNGIIFQWGQTVAGANAYSSDTDFPIAFKNSIFSLVGSKSDKESGAADGNDAGIKYVSLTQFKVYSDDAEETINWIAIGY